MATEVVAKNTKVIKNLDNWKFPSIPLHNLYKKTPFRIFPSNAIRDFEQTISLKPDDKFGSYYLLSSDFLDGFVKKKHNFLHMGLVQVAIKPLARDGLDAPVIVCLRDARHHNKDFKSSLLALVESNLSQGPIYFNCFPSFTVSLTDSSYIEALTLLIQTTGIPLALTVRIVCKAMVDLSVDYLEEPTLGKTSYFHAISGDQTTTQWDEVGVENNNVRSLVPTLYPCGQVMVNRVVSSGCGRKW